MRALVTADRLRRVIQALGARARGPGRIYLTGGATAVLEGWRESTVDIDLKLDPEPAGVFESIAAVKDELDVNVELASPDQFIPPLPGGETAVPMSPGSRRSISSTMTFTPKPSQSSSAATRETSPTLSRWSAAVSWTQHGSGSSSKRFDRSYCAIQRSTPSRMPIPSGRLSGGTVER